MDPRLALAYLLALCFLYGSMLASFAAFGVYLLKNEWIGNRLAFTCALWGTAAVLLAAFVRIGAGG